MTYIVGIIFLILALSFIGYVWFNKQKEYPKHKDRGIPGSYYYRTARG